VAELTTVDPWYSADEMETANRPAHRRRWGVSPRHAVGRLVTATTIGVIAFALFAPTGVEWWVRAIVGWDVGALALVTLAWSIILRADHTETRRRAGADDPGRHLVFAIALASSMFSFFAAAFVLRHVKNLPGPSQLTWTLLTLAAIVLAWVLAHTSYTLRYAHLYYRGGGHHGLQFPGEDPPSDIDFAYFSFTIGMCFQVSDVVVTSTPCRRAVLLHAVLSFVYNTAILALALNLVFGTLT
jgi:uncharacterized membrane protein